ncbi:hypothetical protein [Phenylobacterium sp.]|uniref:terminase small subunit-like protein n=1 Tax=Phenylobacterium sp. TaxID=1871053 RepID=UPI002DE950C8|nr:hypothetical protein [Phenylobacterium sp.]
MAKDRRVPAELRRRREYVMWSEALGRRLCERLAAGELLYVICREPGMPTPEAVAKWAKAKPGFGAALVSARRAGGRAAGTRGPVDTICAEVAEEVFQRLCDGESLTRIGADAAMPCLSTLMRWRRRFPEFEEMVQLGMRVRAERMADEGWDMAMAATPETAYLTHVRLGHLRWMAGVMAPRVFGARRPEGEAAQEKLTVLIRTFTSEVDPVTGKMKVVSLCPNPLTGEMERTDVAGWAPTPPDAVIIPAG